VVVVELCCPASQLPRDHPANGNYLPGSDLKNRLNPSQKALLKDLGIQFSKDLLEGIMRRDTLGQFQSLFQPLGRSEKHAAAHAGLSTFYC